MQANLHRKKLATQEILLESQKQKVAITLVQKPYVGAIGEVKQYAGTRIVQKTQNTTKPIKAAIIVLDEGVEIIENPTLTTENVAFAKIKSEIWSMAMVSMYFKNTQPIEPYLEHLKLIQKEIGPTKFLKGGDCNAWSTWWVSVKENTQGETMAGTLGEMEMHILNEGTEPTFYMIRSGTEYKSHGDIMTFCSIMLQRVHDWRVLKDVTSSDHNTIAFTMKLRKLQIKRLDGRTRIYNTKKADWKKFKTYLEKKLIDNNINKQETNKFRIVEEIEKLVIQYNDTIEAGCKKV